MSAVVCFATYIIIPGIQYENNILQGVAQQIIPTLGALFAFLCFACGLLARKEKYAGQQFWVVQVSLNVEELLIFSVPQTAKH